MPAAKCNRNAGGFVASVKKASLDSSPKNRSSIAFLAEDGKFSGGFMRSVWSEVLSTRVRHQGQNTHAG